MAKTNGHRNPPWTREETILALDLLLSAGMTVLSDSHPRVVALSEFLRGLPSNKLNAEDASFRNAAGVSFKLSNLRNVATGEGFSNVSATDKLVWNQFENRRQKLKEVVNLILVYAPMARLVDQDDTDDDEEFFEGSTITRVHKRIERSRNLRKAVLKARSLSGPLRCDACGKSDPMRGTEFECKIFEVHHLKPLSLTGESSTRVRDTALLCADCHRLAHGLIKRTGRWVDIDELRSLFTR